MRYAYRNDHSHISFPIINKLGYYVVETEKITVGESGSR